MNLIQMQRETYLISQSEKLYNYKPSHK